MRQALEARGGPQVPHNFMQTAPGYDGTARKGRMPQSSPRSPQVILTPATSYLAHILHRVPQGSSALLERGSLQQSCPCSLRDMSVNVTVLDIGVTTCWLARSASCPCACSCQ